MKKENMTQNQMEQALGTFEQFALKSGNPQLADLAKKTIVEYSRIMGSVSKYCGIPERERDPKHPHGPPIPVIDEDKEEWWDSLKAGGAVTTANAGLHNKTIRQPQKEEEEEYEIIPDEKDFWRD